MEVFRTNRDGYGVDDKLYFEMRSPDRLSEETIEEWIEKNYPSCAYGPPFISIFYTDDGGTRVEIAIGASCG